MTERAYGQHGRENAGVSSEMQVRILHTESPRIPGEGSSALGKSGPNARPKGAADGKQAYIPAPGQVRRRSDGDGECDPLNGLRAKRSSRVPGKSGTTRQSAKGKRNLRGVAKHMATAPEKSF